MLSNHFFKALSICATLVIISITPALAQPPHVFGLGQPASLSDLPVGAFRSTLEALPDSAKGRALGILRRATFPVEDLTYMRVHPRGHIYYEDPSFEAEGTGDEFAPPAEITETAALQLHSKPGAANVLYLDFDGHEVIATAWSASALDMRPYSTDGDYYNFSTTELDNIAESWRRVAEDFAPFDIDVTTEEPPFTINAANGRIEFGSNVGHILITQQQDASGSDIYSCNCGGVAYYNGFGSSYLSPGLVFNTSLIGVSEAISHEFGHNLNLSHDGQLPGDGAYYWGHGSGAVSWGPIMGAGYNVNITQWSKDEYLGANNPEDDLAVIASKLFYRLDDHEDVDLNLATPLLVTGGTNIVSDGRVTDPSAANLANRGVIEDKNDFDLFSMNVGVGSINLAVMPAHLETYLSGTRSNLDIEARLLDEAGTVVQTINPDFDTNATLNYAVTTPGTYYLKISGVGRGDPLGDGYTSYGSIGEYFINGTIPEDVVVTLPPVAPNDLTASLLGEVDIVLYWTDPITVPQADEAGYRIYRSVNGETFVHYDSLPRDSSSYSDNNLGNGDYSYYVEVYNSQGTAQTSATDSITVNLPTVAVATSESTAAGSTQSGSYVNTQTLAGSETLSEQHSGGKPKNRTSFLDHAWTVTGVVPGATVELKVRASAAINTENEDFEFSYSLDGVDWSPLGTIWNGEGEQTMTAALHPSANGSVQVRVVDSDPNTVGNKVTDTVTVYEISITSTGDAGDQPPQVSIDSPPDGTTVLTRAEITFQGSADDNEDGDLTNELSWSSSLDGHLGTGTNLIATSLSEGDHEVTARVEDSAGQTGEDSITVTVTSTPQPTTMSVSDLDGTSALEARAGKWKATVTVTVLNDLGDWVSGAEVSGNWSAGASGSSSCTTDASGECEITKGGLKSNVSSATFSVTQVSGSLTYEPSDNSDLDDDSDGTSITVAKP